MTATYLYALYVSLPQKAAYLSLSTERTNLCCGMKIAWIKPVQVFSVRDTLLELSYYLCLVDFFLLFLEIFLFIKLSAGFSVQEQLTTGGVLWFPDLTALDSTWILPVSLGVINLLIVEVSGFKCICLPFKSLDFCCCSSDMKFKCDWVGGDSSELECRLLGF